MREPVDSYTNKKKTTWNPQSQKNTKSIHIIYGDIFLEQVTKSGKIDLFTSASDFVQKEIQNIPSSVQYNTHNQITKTNLT